MGSAGRRLRAAVAAGVMVVATACGPAPTPSPPPNETLGGMGVLQQIPGERYPGADRALTGTVELLANGCVNVVVEGESLLALWPAG